MVLLEDAVVNRVVISRRSFVPNILDLCPPRCNRPLFEIFTAGAGSGAVLSNELSQSANEPEADDLWSIRCPCGIGDIFDPPTIAGATRYPIPTR